MNKFSIESIIQSLYPATVFFMFLAAWGLSGQRGLIEKPAILFPEKIGKLEAYVEQNSNGVTTADLLLNESESIPLQ